MPKILEIGSYIIYFWSEENGEPIHVHVSVKRPEKNSTKLWVLRNGETVVAYNRNGISQKELKKIQENIKINVEVIIAAWCKHFNTVSYHQALELLEKNK